MLRKETNMGKIIHDMDIKILSREDGCCCFKLPRNKYSFLKTLELVYIQKSTNKAKNSLTGKSGNALCDWVVYEHRQIFSKYKTNHISPPGRAVYLYNIFTDLKSNIQIQSQLSLNLTACQS